MSGTAPLALLADWLSRGLPYTLLRQLWRIHLTFSQCKTTQLLILGAGPPCVSVPCKEVEFYPNFRAVGA